MSVNVVSSLEYNNQSDFNVIDSIYEDRQCIDLICRDDRTTMSLQYLWYVAAGML